MTKPDSKAKLPSPRRLLADSLKLYRQHWRLLVTVVAVISIPSAVLVQLTADPILGSYLALATLLMNLALIWAVMEIEAGRPAKLGHAYYRGTGQIVSFLLVAIALTLQLVPFTLGAALYVNAFSTSVGTPAEQLLIGLIWLILSIPSVFWLVGSIFALFAVQDPEVRPLLALKTSHQAVKGRRLPVAGRLVALAAAFIVLLAIPSIGLALLPSVAWVKLLQIVLQVVVGMTLLPLSYIYILKLYRSL